MADSGGLSLFYECGTSHFVAEQAFFRVSKLTFNLRMKSFFLTSPHCRQCAAAGCPGVDSVQGALHHSETFPSCFSASVCWRLRRLPLLHPGGGPVSEQRLGRSGCTGEEGDKVRYKIW